MKRREFLASALAALASFFLPVPMPAARPEWVSVVDPTLRQVYRVRVSFTELSMVTSEPDVPLSVEAGPQGAD